MGIDYSFCSDGAGGRAMKRRDVGEKSIFFLF